MKLSIKKKYFDEIKAGKKKIDFRDAHITFVCEEDKTSKYRMRIECLKCGCKYVTNVRSKKGLPRRCKKCGSSRLLKRNRWRISR
jgi:peptide subunit release factor 1 (eRF1)